MNLDLKHLQNSFQNSRVIVLGDVMLDSYFIGKINRISPEAPVPVVDVFKKEHRLGGAANVALNLVKLGAIPILCSTRGNDRDGERLSEILTSQKIGTQGIVIDLNRPTTVKTRIIGNDKQVVRVDEEVTGDISTKIEHEILDFLKIEIPKSHALLIQDYNKGLLTPWLIKKSIQLANKFGIPILVDPKKKNFSLYRNVTLFKPNKKEIEEGMSISIHTEDVEGTKMAMANLASQLKAKHVMLTLSEGGVAINDEEEFYKIAAHHRNIIDVSGAGDSVISVATLAYVAKLPINDVARLANRAGGLVCEKLGVQPLTWDILAHDLS